MSGLLRRLRSFGVGIGLGGVLALSSGCMSDQALVGVGLSALGVGSKDPRLGQAAYVAGQGILNNANAKEGASNVTTNVIVPSNSSAGEIQYYKGKLADGSDYEGEIKNGLPEGMGTRIIQNGRGVIIDGTSLRGIFRNGFFERGVATTPNRGRYEGEFMPGNDINMINLWNGTFTYTLPSGEESVRAFKDGVAQ